MWCNIWTRPCIEKLVFIITPVVSTGQGHTTLNHMCKEDANMLSPHLHLDAAVPMGHNRKVGMMLQAHNAFWIKLCPKLRIDTYESGVEHLLHVTEDYVLQIACTCRLQSSWQQLMLQMHWKVSKHTHMWYGRVYPSQIAQIHWFEKLDCQTSGQKQELREVMDFPWACKINHDHGAYPLLCKIYL